MDVPSKGETFAQLIEHLRLAQEAAAMLGHLSQAHGDRRTGLGWLTVSEGLKVMQANVTELAKKGLQ
jgi:predicted XRE-type DNA-binding protein